MLICPVRHHSPAAALQVARLIHERRPHAVLVEGPADATSLIPLLLKEDTVPPVAIYAYRPGDEVRATFYPFCGYSPEYAALKAGQELGSQLAFCDVPAGATLRRDETDPTREPPELDEAIPATDGPQVRNGGGTSPDVLPDGYEEYARALAKEAGFDDFEEFWEAVFEQEAGGAAADVYLSALTEFGARARLLGAREPDDWDVIRERHMAAAALAATSDAGEVLLVCGAAHASEIQRYVAEGVEAPALETVAIEVVLTPYSFPRLGEQSGYGAGNRAPWFYQQIWELSGDYRAASRRSLVTVARALRSMGQTASAAEVIDAFNLAVVLARMREKAAPGVDEVREAATSCFGHGQPAVVASALDRVLVGDRVGRLTHLVGRTPLQSEFYSTAQRFGMQISDAPSQLLLHMADPREAEPSIFLHRLVSAGVPYGQELQGGLSGGGRAFSGGPLKQIARVREKWQLQWSPATDAHLIERSAWGSTLTEVCGRLISGRLDNAARIDDGTAVLFDLALCDLIRDFPRALEKCEALAADSASFAPLARATYHLDGLLTYGAARHLPTEELRTLASRLFERAALHLTSAAVCGDDAADDVATALKGMHELVRRRAAAAAESGVFWQSVEILAQEAGSHPALRGLAMMLMELEGRLEQDELAERIGYWLSTTFTPAENAHLVSGLFSMQRGTLLRNRALIGAITDFLADLELEQITPLLPVLRRSLGNLSASERMYLSETLARLLGALQSEARWSLAVSSTEGAWLAEADAAASATMANWKARYGIG